MFDLRVYYRAAPHVLSGSLYDFQLVRADPGALPLPFTYPPFAALLFLPLAALPWWAAAGIWHLLSLLSLVLLIRGAARMLPEGTARPTRDQLTLWTAGALWLEPVRHTFNLGQISLILGAVVLTAVGHRRPVVAGLGVGLAAGIKLTPAACGLYFLAARKWAAAAWSAAAFAATVGLAWLLAPADSAQFWFHALRDTGRIGHLESPENQSLRGALTRFVGHDIGFAAPWWIAAALVTVAAGLALRTAARRGDTLAMVITAQLLGLLLCPISWSHHWVWILPTLIWLVHGPLARAAWCRVAAAAWLVATATWAVPLTGVVTNLNPAATARTPWYLLGPSWIYPLCALLTFAAIALGRGDGESAQSASAATALANPDQAAVVKVSAGP
ncbi:glycosyltransferase 87 family protein [Kitasatospora nipponensis]